MVIKPEYQDFIYNNCYYMRPGINTIENDICIPNDIFDRIKKLGFRSNLHITFAFGCYAILLMTNSFPSKYYALNKRRLEDNSYIYGYEMDQPIESICLNNSELKSFWGYSPENKKLDYITKNNGLLDRLELTEFFIKGYKHIKYKADRNEGFYFKVPSDILFYCKEIKEIGVIGFTIYSLICRHNQLKQTSKSALAKNYFINVLGIDGKTIFKYLKALEKYKLITVERSNCEDEWGDFISHDVNKYTAVRTLNENHLENYPNRNPEINTYSESDREEETISMIEKMEKLRIERMKI